MSVFQETTHLSEILELSEKTPVVIFIYSSQCGSSSRLSAKIEENILNKTIAVPVYKVTVQTQPALSEKIESFFGIKHESPQILTVQHGKVTYTDHHSKINIQKFL